MLMLMLMLIRVVLLTTYEVNVKIIVMFVQIRNGGRCFHLECQELH